MRDHVSSMASRQEVDQECKPMILPTAHYEPLLPVCSPSLSSERFPCVLAYRILLLHICFYHYSRGRVAGILCTRSRSVLNTYVRIAHTRISKRFTPVCPSARPSVAFVSTGGRSSASANERVGSGNRMITAVRFCRWMAGGKRGRSHSCGGMCRSLKSRTSVNRGGKHMLVVIFACGYGGRAARGESLHITLGSCTTVVPRILETRDAPSISCSLEYIVIKEWYYLPKARHAFYPPFDISRTYAPPTPTHAE